MSDLDKSRSYDDRPAIHIQAHKLAVLRGHRQSVDAVYFSPDGSTLASVASDDGVRLWNVSQRALLHVLEQRQGAYIPSQLSFSADGKLLAASVGNGIIQLWTTDGKIVGEMLHDVGVTAVAFSPDGGLLVSGDLAGQVQLWDVESLQVISTFPGVSHGRVGTPLPPAAGVQYFTFTPDGELLAFECPDKWGLAQVWNVRHPRLGVEWVGSVGRPQEILFDLSFSPDGKVLALASFDQRNVQLFDSQTLTATGILPMPDNDLPKSIAFSPDSGLLATAGAAGTVWIWEIRNQRVVASFAAHPEGPDHRKGAQEWAIGGIDWSPNGNLMATSGRDPYLVKLWKVEVQPER